MLPNLVEKAWFQKKQFHLDKANINSDPEEWETISCHLFDTQRGLQPYGDSEERWEVNNNMFFQKGHHTDLRTTTVPYEHKEYQ